MNVTPSKLLLGLSLAALTYINWDHFGSSKIETKAPDKPKDAAAAAINRTITLALASDPFGSKPVAGAGGVTPGSVLAAAAVEGSKSTVDISLQGIFLAGGHRVALINGKPLREGELVALPDGPLVKAIRVGEDFAVVQGNGQLMTLRMELPNVADKGKTEATPTGHGPARSQVAGVNPSER